MKSLIAGLAILTVGILVPAASQAHEQGKVYRPGILLRILTYDTGHGTAHRSEVFGRSVTGDLRFRTIGERDTRREGYGQTGYAGWRR